MPPTLPNQRTWRFERIATKEPQRAAALEVAGSPPQLLEGLRAAFRKNLQTNEVRFAHEESGCQRADLRVIVQLQLTSEQFDWFFNARTGYRAHYRIAPETGLRFNTDVIEVVREELQMSSLDSFRGRRFDQHFQDLGEASISKAFALASLNSDISKVWLCTTLINLDGVHKRMPTGTSDTRLLVDDVEWLDWFRSTDDSWIEMKGAFLGPHGPYQLKDSWSRALRLHESGKA